MSALAMHSKLTVTMPTLNAAHPSLVVVSHTITSVVVFSLPCCTYSLLVTSLPVLTAHCLLLLPAHYLLPKSIYY